MNIYIAPKFESMKEKLQDHLESETMQNCNILATDVVIDDDLCDVIGTYADDLEADEEYQCSKVITLAMMFLLGVDTEQELDEELYKLNH